MEKMHGKIYYTRRVKHEYYITSWHETSFL